MNWYDTTCFVCLIMWQGSLYTLVYSVSRIKSSLWIVSVQWRVPHVVMHLLSLRLRRRCGERIRCLTFALYAFSLLLEFSSCLFPYLCVCVYVCVHPQVIHPVFYPSGFLQTITSHHMSHLCFHGWLWPTLQWSSSSTRSWYYPLISVWDSVISLSYISFVCRMLIIR